MNNFEQWIRDCAPEVKIDDIRKEAHLAVLKERLRQREIQHRHRGRLQLRASMAAVVVVFMLVSGNFSQLGSDGMGIKVLPSSLNDRGQLVQVGDVGVLHVRIPEGLTPEETMEMVTVLKTRDGDVLEFYSYQGLGGKVWGFARNQIINGESKKWWGGADGYEMENGRDLAVFLVKDDLAVNFINEVDSGHLQPSGIKQMVVEGRLFDVKIYDRIFPEVGKITALVGLPAQ